MANSTVQSNNRRIQFLDRVTDEWFQGSLYGSYQGNNPTAVIQRIMDLSAQGGSQLNIPLLIQATGKGVGRGPLVGNEEKLDNYGDRAFADFARNAWVMTRAEQQEDNGAIWNRVTPIASNWAVQREENDITEALMALPTDGVAPVGWQSDAGATVNGILYEKATTTQLNTWGDDNEDRILYGASVANYVAGDYAASLANVAAADTLSGSTLSKLKSIAKKATPAIGPTRYNAGKNRRYMAAFCGPIPFADLKEDLKTVNLDGRPRDVGANPVFQDGDLEYDGIIIREIPNIDNYVEEVWTDLLTAGDGGIRVNPVFLCGQGALAKAIGEMPMTTRKTEDDYGMSPGRGIEMMYGMKKVAKKAQDTDVLKQWGVATGFFANSAQ